MTQTWNLFKTRPIQLTINKEAVGGEDPTTHSGADKMLLYVNRLRFILTSERSTREKEENYLFVTEQSTFSQPSPSRSSNERESEHFLSPTVVPQLN